MKHVQLKAGWCLTGFCCILMTWLSAQDQKVADSLSRIYPGDKLPDTIRLELLRNLAFNEMRDMDLGLRYAEELITLASATENSLYLHRGYQQKGNKLILKGDPEGAMEAYIKSAEAAQQAGYIKGQGAALGAIADAYANSGNHANAMVYYRKAINLLAPSGDSAILASVISNAGDAFLQHKDYDSALVYFQESARIFGQIDYLSLKAYNLGNIGMVYANTGKKDLAERNINEAIRILEETEDYSPICTYLLSMSDIFQHRGDMTNAMGYAQRSLALAEQYKLQGPVSDASRKLSELYEQLGDQGAALRYFKKHIAYRDSVRDLSTVEKMANLRTEFEVSQKQGELDLANEEKRAQRMMLLSLLAILGLGAILLGTLFWYYRAIAREKKRSESLLLNILPAETAKELKKNGRVEAVKFDQVTVLFTDFVGFSKVAESVEPEQLVKSIDHYFREFDEISSRHGLEKIKTVGDSYMCACGLPTANPAHAVNVIRAAMDMIDLVNRELRSPNGLSHFEIRIGVHTGPVVAGIVGIKKWQYDIWGDTVNIASRMESNSEPGRINISETTYHQIHGEFPCTFRGEIEVKNHGALKMYFVDRPIVA
jgi:class 3 adenylate cyclase/tetratricopeptide (TPR) repeat protein